MIHEIQMFIHIYIEFFISSNARSFIIRTAKISTWNVQSACGIASAALLYPSYFIFYIDCWNKINISRKTFVCLLLLVHFTVLIGRLVFGLCVYAFASVSCLMCVKVRMLRNENPHFYQKYKKSATRWEKKTNKNY